MLPAVVAPLPHEVVGTPAGYDALKVAIDDAVSAESAAIASFGFELPPSRPRIVPSALPSPDSTACVKPPFTKSTGLPKLRVHWVTPEIVVQVAFTEWTPGGKLRHPRLLGLRPDKAAREVVREDGKG